MSQRRGAQRSCTLFQSNWARQGTGYFNVGGIRNLAHLPSTWDLWCFLCRCVNCPLDVLCVSKRNFLREFIIDYVEVRHGLLWRHLWWSMMMRWNCCAGWKGWNSQSLSITSITVTKKEKAHSYLCNYLKGEKCAWTINANARYVNTNFPSFGESFFSLVLMQKKNATNVDSSAITLILKCIFMKVQWQKQTQSVIHNDSS